ncbi:FadR/GntR family transcriptional regulator [Jiangella asiatica]|uniref:FadR family transcriptional regulator n=1 Tax=Jiangella asiatica TaxID=2530372 RepID=A0A4R5CM17_9ACTN|nr:FCD domain-containing protein [Jiangella asiatica]TDE01016.1 FadR family transcriptional regulator [Jiangella asiatica]
MSRVPIFQEAQARLREFIRDRGLGPGDRLPPEAVLAAELGVSRVSMREATRSLQTMGVIEAQPGVGLFVAPFSFRPLLEQLPYGLAPQVTAFSDILTAREAMEVGLMSAVARASSAADLARCAALARTMTDQERAGKSIAETDRQFHLTLYKSLDNPLVDSLIEVFWELFVRLIDTLARPDDDGRGLRHLRIVEALQSGDAALSMLRMQEHFDDVRARATTLPSAP